MKDIRFRDAYLKKDNGVVCICIFTRMGGGNRESYEEVIRKLQAHPCYVKDYDDDFDETYATFCFHLPRILNEIKDGLALHCTDKTPMDDFREIIQRIKAGLKE